MHNHAITRTSVDQERVLSGGLAHTYAHGVRDTRVGHVDTIGGGLVTFALTQRAHSERAMRVHACEDLLDTRTVAREQLRRMAAEGVRRERDAGGRSFAVGLTYGDGAGVDERVLGIHGR